MPDPRLGERVAAYVRLRPGSELTMEQVTELFGTAGVAKQKTPERLITLDEFPYTPTGKIKKFELRDRVRAMVSEEAERK
ncbi:hypothetical protein C5E45_03590 [Nocardia nova]|uniref:AMP-binding enzyme C-terminal domain-containing protein n=1 Tax=Nocardia nova TaxID=37330 RepID=A0A2S6AVL5_9NOCA|nr:hypothetical protein C5E41_02510 [Nocardia nova]PPJ39271.1 hypothetical protein C5E45_03590 [Nocardia nova]